MKEDYDPPEKRIEKFWIETFKESNSESVLSKELTLPLARIKRLMKVEENVKMVASEVPIMFSKIAEKFIEELTLRAWINTEENKRRILQRTDISVAVKTSEMYDFLVYIIPRSETIQIFDHPTEEESSSSLGGVYVKKSEIDFNQQNQGEYLEDTSSTED